MHQSKESCIIESPNWFCYETISYFPERLISLRKAVLFDLDGTLLPMDQDAFTKYYFKLLVGTIAPRGYEPNALLEAVISGVTAMVKNDGSCTNEEAFWKCFSGVFGDRVYADIPYFESFYKNEFQQAKAACGYDEGAKAVIGAAKKKGLRVALATNPLFPSIATESRIRWAGLQPEDFELFTTYENSCHCKPNLDYYRDILREMDLRPEECLMVGNDVGEDMIAKELGMDVFLLTPCLLNRSELDISRYPQGGFNELLRYIENI